MNWIKEQHPDDKIKQEEIKKAGAIPRHIAIIMDGNGRWAVENKKNRIFGHKAGIDSVRDVVKACSLMGIKHLTLYAFSIENWKRPISEVSGLMSLLESYMVSEMDELHENNVRFNSIGKLSSLPKVIQKLIHTSSEKTKENTGLTLNLALSYSGRWDIVRAVQMIGLDIRRGKVSPEDITEETFASYLQTFDMPDPDLLIRTSGEMRLSNFLLWEMAYGEIFITDKFWPEFRRDNLYEAITNYVHRERRFGKTSIQLENEKDNLETQENESNSIIKRVVDVFKKS